MLHVWSAPLEPQAALTHIFQCVVQCTALKWRRRKRLQEPSGNCRFSLNIHIHAAHTPLFGGKTNPKQDFHSHFLSARRFEALRGVWSQKQTRPVFFFFFFQRRRTQTAGYQTEQCTEEGTTAAFEGMLEQTHRDTCVRRPIKASDCGLDVTSLYQTGTQASPVIPGSDKWTQFPFIYLSFVRTTGHHVAVPLHKSLCCYGNHRISTTNQACRASSAKDVNNSGCGISENIWHIKWTI